VPAQEIQEAWQSLCRLHDNLSVILNYVIHVGMRRVPFG
jgi:hypothetical protein